MTEISLENLNALVSAGEKLKRLLTETPEVLEYLRLVSGGEEKILTPLYTPYSNRIKFWLSEVKGVAKKGQVKKCKI